MKRYSNKLIMTALAGSALLFTACQDGDNPIDEINANETRGAILRTVELTSNELPIGVSTAEFSGTFEIQDQEDGTLVDFVEVFVGFSDNTVEDGAPDGSVPESIYETLDTSDPSIFELGEFGYPRFDYGVSLAEMLAFTGVDESILLGGDQFNIRFELVLNDGRRYSFDDNTNTLTGSFFSSPFLYSPTVVCPIFEDQFVGEYLLVTAPDSPVGGVPVWNEQVVTLTIGETSTQRIFSAIYLEGLGFTGANEFVFDLVCNEVIVPTGQASGLQCVSGITLGPAEGVDPGSYDSTDDSTFTIIFAEDETNDCGAGTPTITATLTKQ